MSNCNGARLSDATMEFVITHTSPVSETVIRVEGASVDGAVIVVDIVRCFLPAIAIGNTMQLEIGTHILAYAINVHVVAVSAGCMLASYGGLVLRLDGGLSVDQAPSPGSQMKMSLSCSAMADSNKRVRCVA